MPDASAPAPKTQPVPITVLTTRPGTNRRRSHLRSSISHERGPRRGRRTGRSSTGRRGRVGFKPLPSGTTAYDFRVQEYRGEPVITWIESQGAFSTGPTTGYIADRHYRTIATVTAGSGLIADIHEFHLTPEGTALISAYHTVSHDLSSVGGPENGLVTDGVVQEIDIASGRVVFEWHSLDHIGLDESQSPVPASPTVAWDYFHLNAVSLDEDGNLLVGARNTWAAYRVDRHSGAVIWRLGGTKSDFALGPDVAFAWQHNPTAADDRGLVPGASSTTRPARRCSSYSRVIWVRHDDVRKTATLERWFKHPDNLSAGSQGNAEALDNGDTFVDWGALPRFSEFDRHDNLVFDAAFPAGYNSYRAYRATGGSVSPDTLPTATEETTQDKRRTPSSTPTWNGATGGRLVGSPRGLGPTGNARRRRCVERLRHHRLQVREPLGSFVVASPETARASRSGARR